MMSSAKKKILSTVMTSEQKPCGDEPLKQGTHWVCYKKIQEKSYYFDSFGLDPPEEIINYLKNNGEDKEIKINVEDNIIECSTFQIQEFGAHNCGYHCLLVLKMLEIRDFQKVVLSLI
uniref:ULP_PROTEASE domain-containing protein n=1 Tax=Heterorhabditis bacteriophora TaxID=37862 RepID=A0A1I7X7L0_HETBA